MSPIEEEGVCVINMDANVETGECKRSLKLQFKAFP